MEKKKITVLITDKDGSVLLEYSEPVEISRGAMENITWIKKGVWTIKELLNINISKELDRAREEGRREGSEITSRYISDFVKSESGKSGRKEILEYIDKLSKLKQ